MSGTLLPDAGELSLTVLCAAEDSSAAVEDEDGGSGGIVASELRSGTLLSVSGLLSEAPELSDMAVSLSEETADDAELSPPQPENSSMAS